MKFLFLLSTIASAAVAQLLTTGTTQLPACALQCTALNNAVAACGGQTTSTQQNWICFCQSAYLTGLKTNPPGAVCDAFCTDPTQNQQVISWYGAQCGSDLGASEHPGNGQAAPGLSSSSTSTTLGTTTTPTGTQTTNLPQSTNTRVPDVAPSQINTSTGDWWSGHWKWIVMVLVIILGIVGLIFALIYFKRRHERRQDTITGGFNEGITTRPAPQAALVSAPQMEMNSPVRDSPIRTRDAFMPYGYGYSRSESRQGSRTDLSNSQTMRGSPLAHNGIHTDEITPIDNSTPGGKKKRIHVRERSID